MGAIHGLCSPAPDVPANAQRLEAGVAALAGCGPHGGGAWARGPAALAAAILHDTPEARHERQPLVSLDGRWVLVADARLDNRDELLDRLAPGTAPAETPDSALLLAAWERWGTACCERLLGDFAFAVWDTRQQRLVCARDPMGIKPFYYHHAPRGLGLVFASQLAGLLALAEVPRRLDRLAAADHLLALGDDRERTLFADVLRLPPGHRLVVVPGGAPRLERYWRPVPARGLRRATLDDWAAALGAEIARAVAARTRTAGGVAAHLSGGLDSSAVACLAADALTREGRPLRALSFSLPPEGDGATPDPVDAPFIAAVREASGVEVHYHPFGTRDFHAALADAAPGMGPPDYRTTALHRWARDEGLRVVLSGWGGDEAASFNGRGYPADLAVTGRWRELARLMRQLQRHGRIRSRRRFLLQRVVAPLAPAALLPRIPGARRPLAGLIDVSPISEALARPADARRRLRGGRLGGVGTRRTRQRLLDEGYLVARIESWSADAARFGLDYRYPLLDRRLLELALALPGRAFVRNGVSRWVFRKALAGRVPDVVLWRPGKRDSLVQRHRAQRLADARGAVPSGPDPCLAKLLTDGNDLGGCIDLDRLRRQADALSAGGHPPATDLTERLPELALDLLATLVMLIEHYRIDCD